MPDDFYDPFDTVPRDTGSRESGSQKSESHRVDEDLSTIPEADESGTYGLGKPIELPKLAPPPAPVIESRELEQDEAGAGTPLKRPVRRDSSEEADPLVGDSMVSAMWYPLSGHRIRVLGLFTVLFWLCPLVPFLRMIAVLLAGAYAGLLLLETIAFTMERLDVGLRLPEFGFESLQSGMFAMSVVVIAELPLFLMGMMFAGSGLSPLITIPLNIGCVFFVMYYVPMGLIAIAQIEDVSALNPLFVFRGIRKMGGMYFVLVTTAVIPFAIPYFVLNSLEVHWAIVALVCSFFMIYSLVALMRAVAIVFRDRRIQLAQAD